MWMSLGKAFYKENKTHAYNHVDRKLRHNARGRWRGLRVHNARVGGTEMPFLKHDQYYVKR
jgi:hypothetical protein